MNEEEILTRRDLWIKKEESTLKKKPAGRSTGTKSKGLF